MSEGQDASSINPNNTPDQGPVFEGFSEAERQALKAAAFDRLVNHLQQRTDVQNIDLMNLAGFCRNCLGKWLSAAASAQGLELDKESGRHAIYGMPPAEWKSRYQTD
jgi:hypothetical protein